MFAFILADRWGMPVGELLGRVDSRELSEWMAFEKVRPPSEEWQRHAALMHWLGCLHVKRPPKYEKFLPARKHRRAMTPAEMRAVTSRFAH